MKKCIKPCQIRIRLIWENLLQFLRMAVIIRPKMRFWRMDEPSENSNKGGKTSVNKFLGDFVDGLSDEHRMLVVLKAQLYGGIWELMLDDLKTPWKVSPIYLNW